MSAAPAALGKRARTELQNRAAILLAAREAFAELGYDAAGVRDVIGRTELASGTFYNYFPDKETVFLAVIDESAHELRRRLRSARAAAGDLEGFVGQAYRTLFAYLVEDRLVFELLKRNAGPIRSRFGDPVLGAGVRELVEDLGAAIARGGPAAAPRVPGSTACNDEWATSASDADFLPSQPPRPELPDLLS